MARDNFSASVTDRLAKRAGMKCSFPDCRLPTSGPNSLDGVTNVGVAAHITAASPGGPRHDPSISSDQRGSIDNGIWLCQTHAKLIDDDELAYPALVLLEWKSTSEQMASLEARGFMVRRAKPFPDLERKAPTLIAEMRADVGQTPMIREFVVLPKRVTYNSGGKTIFMYHPEDHEYLDGLITIMQHAGAIYSTAFNNVPRYNFTEEFVSYLLGD